MTAPQDAVRTVVASVPHHIDAKRWDDLRGLYAARVAVDYTQLFGGEAEEQAGDELVAGWRGQLAEVATQHLLGPIEVELGGEAASARCHVRALHRKPGAPGGDTWEVLGHYRFELAQERGRWTIAGMKLEVLVQLGNRELLSAGSKK